MPLRPERVVEVRYDHMEGTRFRHTAQFVRWRAGPDAGVVHLRPARGAGQLRPRRRALGRLRERAPERPGYGVAVYTILVLTEDALTPHDVARIAALHGDEPVQAHLLVPVETHPPTLVDTLDEVALGRFVPRTQHRSDPVAHAQTALDTSLASLTEAGVGADGALAGDDPVGDAVTAATHADEVIVVTQPHLLEEALRRDWASRVREATGKPVLHVVAGTDRVVSIGLDDARRREEPRSRMAARLGTWNG